MSDAVETAPVGPLALDDSDFWSGEVVLTTRNALVAEILAREDPRGVVIDAPRKADVDRHTSLPVLGLYVRRMLDDQVMRFDERAIAVAVNLGTHEVYVGPAFDRGKLLAPSEHAPIPLMGSVTTVDLFDGDWRGASGLPWEPGRLKLSLLVREHRSNSVEVELERTLTFEDPEVARYLDAQREKRPSRPGVVYPPHPKTPEWDETPLDQAGWLPKYLEVDGCPPLPEEPGIALATERVQLLSDASRCVLHGSYRLPVLEREVVMSNPEGGYPDVGDSAANAVVPITLVVTGSEAMGPFVFRLQVPSYDTIHLEDDPVLVSGWFTVDLMSLGLPRSAQTFFLTAFSGPHACGPIPFAFVSEDMLRKV